MVLSKSAVAPTPGKSGFLRCDLAHDVAFQTRKFIFTLLDQRLASECIPGRYLMLEYSDGAGRPRRACYSIVACPAAYQVEILVHRASDQGMSEGMHKHLVVGSLVLCTGVGGDITAPRFSDFDSLALLAGGIGLTLPLALIRELRGRAREQHRVPRVTLLLCTPALEAIPYLAELLALELTDHWFTLRIHVTREALYQGKGCIYRGRPEQSVLMALGECEGVVICGSQAFVSRMQQIMAMQHGKARCFVEAFSPPDAPTPTSSVDTAAVRVKVPSRGLDFDALTSVSLLEQLEAQGQLIRSQCRAGICGACKIRIVEGECRREADFALSVKERQAGYALACCSFPMTDGLTIDI